MTTVKVNAGICGFRSIIKVSAADMTTAQIYFRTECPNLMPLQDELKGVDAFRSVLSKSANHRFSNWQGSIVNMRHALCLRQSSKELKWHAIWLCRQM